MASSRQWFHKVRLIRLADKLEGKGPYKKVGPVPDHKFDMAYLYTPWRGCPQSMVERLFNPRECKTAACGLGWARIDPWFIKRAKGFWGIGSNFFGLTANEFEYLFTAAAYGQKRGRFAKASKVAARIREVAAR